MAISLLLLGASYAFADGMLNDAPTTRSLGGVGNYLFRSTGPVHEKKNELVNRPTVFEEEPAYPAVEELSVRQSSAIAPVQAITFPKASARITPSERARLDAVADTLKSDSTLKATIVGYTDSEGPAGKNEKLSEERAEAVVRGLKKRGVPGHQLSWRAKGENDPVSDNSTPEGRAQNRRVEIQYQ